MFYQGDALEEMGSEHADLDICICREADRWKLRLIGNATPGASFYIYSAHLSSATQAERLCGVTNIRADADLFPEGTQVIYAGDMNFGHNQEPGYGHFLSDGPGQAFDALGTRPWNCSADPFTAIKHTQSPRDNGAPLCGLIPGGMDDRFDFLLMTAELLDGKGIDYLPGTYRALGNDGMHCELAINDGDNFYYPADVARSNALADALHDASDHLPVVADYQIVCPWDLDGDGSVGILDLLTLLAAWGTDPGGPPDFDGDGTVGILDLLTLLANWGPCV